MAVPKVDSSLFPADHRAGRSSFKRNNKMKHTQGKWEASKRYDLKKNLVGISISDTEKKIGVMTTYSNKQLPMDEVQANANLIASAPEMLELLKKIAHGEVDGSSNKVFDLIAKAEGNTDHLIMAELYRQTKAEGKS